MQKKKQRMEKALWLIKWVKAGLWSFILEISHWTVFPGHVDLFKLTAIKLTHPMRTIHVIACRREPTCSSYLNQVLKISYISVYVNHFDVWVPHKLSRTKSSSLDLRCTSLFDDQAKPVTAWLGSSDSSPRSPDIPPLGFHLFRVLQSSLNGKKFQFPGRMSKTPETVLCSKKIKF